MITIHTREEFDQAIQSSAVSVMLFTTKWCGDCMFIKPFMPLKNWKSWVFLVLSALKMEEKFPDLFLR